MYDPFDHEYTAESHERVPYHYPRPPYYYPSSVMSSQAAHANASTPANAALHGMNAAFVVAACIALAGFLLSFILKKKPRQPEQQQAVTR